MVMENEIALYDKTRRELRMRLDKKFPAGFDLENIITAYAYWVCTVIRNHGRDWKSVVDEYVDFAIRDAVVDNESEQFELNIIRKELGQSSGRLLDVGAGWGRYASIYEELGLSAVYVEPSTLGCRLMQRNHMSPALLCLGQQLCLSTASFDSVVIAWVLHHDAPDMPALEVLKEIARITKRGGILISIEPLRVDFDEEKWRALLKEAGFEVKKTEQYYNAERKDMEEQHTMLRASR
jgi:SAM-dependent methyltransferase